MREFKFQLAPPVANIYGYQFYLSIVSSKVSAPPWNIDVTPFYIQLQNKKIKGDLGVF